MTPASQVRLHGLRRKLWRRPGARLAAIQVVVVILAFVGAGLVARADIQASSERTIRQEIRGEMSSLQDEIQRHGEMRLSSTIMRRTRLWRGFEYELISPEHGALSGRLDGPGRTNGWSIIAGRGDWGRDRKFLTLTQPTPSARQAATGVVVLAMMVNGLPS